MAISQENPEYLSGQLISCIGNKRALLGFIGQGLEIVQKRLGKKKLVSFDVFSGSGIVSRFLKSYSSSIHANDLEEYSATINKCYLSNSSELQNSAYEEIYPEVLKNLGEEMLEPGFITESYAPRDEENIRHGDRVFYTRRNAMYIDSARKLIEAIPEDIKKFFLGPLLSAASIRANTAGVFKGFYKNRDTGIGQFGGKNRDALSRITGKIELERPVLSNFECDYNVYCGDANLIADTVPEVDIAYLDPPYNQHPYGSNYFMLNLICSYKRPVRISTVSGIPEDWKRSQYNSRLNSYSALKELTEKLKARFILVSFNSEGFIGKEELLALLEEQGSVNILETKYNTFRAARNLALRNIHTKEYLFLLEKR